MQSHGDHREQLTRPLAEIIIHIPSSVMGEIDAYPLFGSRYSRLAIASPENGTDWINGSALPSPFLVFFPNRFNRFLWNAKSGPDWKDESGGLIIIIVGAADDLFQTPPLQGLIPVPTTPP